MAPTPSIRIWKTFTYRDAPKTWANRYHFNGPVPSTQAYFDSLAVTLLAAEGTFLPSSVSTTLCELLPAGSDVPQYQHYHTDPGTLPTTGGTACPGDCAAVVRYSTPARSKKNHPIYLFNYYHGVLFDSVEGVPDELFPAQKTALTTYAQNWLNGWTWGGGIGTIDRAGPNGVTATGQLVQDWVTHRDFPR